MRLPSLSLAVFAIAVVLLSGCQSQEAPQGKTAGKEVETLRIGTQFGIDFMLLDVAQARGFIEQQAKAEGLTLKVETHQLSGGPAINEALLSGAIDIAGAGTGPLFTIWDRTRGRQGVRAVASLGNFPYQLISTSETVHSIDDLSNQDRIALPAVGVSIQSRILQYASAQRWGQDQAQKLDALQVALSHPDAAAALISGGSEVNAHFSTSPYQQQELARNPKAHAILNSYEVLGGPFSATLLYATEQFHQDNPKVYRALLTGLNETAKFITAHPEEAADIYARRNPGSDKAQILEILRDPQIQFKITPENTLLLGKFMQQIGAIKQSPSALSDYFFDDPLVAGGS